MKNTNARQQLWTPGGASKLPPPATGAPPPVKKPEPQSMASGMKLAKAKDLFEYGVILGAEITPNPLKEGWILQLRARTGEVSVLETDRGSARVFKTLDAAFKTCQEVGLETALVVRKR